MTSKIVYNACISRIKFCLDSDRIRRSTTYVSDQGKNMKAIVVSEFGDENVMRLQETAMPEPGEGEVRICICAAGVNPVETYIRAGQYGLLPKLPYTPGNDGSGVIDKVGAGVTGFKAGQRVFIVGLLAKRNTGTYAEYAVCDAKAVCPFPDALPLEYGAGLGTPGLAATDALFIKAKIRAGEIVLIHGASGGVGTLAVQLARRAGAVVLGTADDEQGRKMVLELGAHHAFIHNEEGYLQKIVESTDGKGPDVIIEMLANVNLAKDLSILAKYGRVVVVGNRGTLEFNPRDTMMKDATVMGMLANNIRPDDFKICMHTIIAGLESGMRVVADRELPLADAPEAHRRVMVNNKAGKVFLKVADL